MKNVDWWKSQMLDLFCFHNVVTYGNFTLRSGESSDYFVNLADISRGGILHPTVCEQISTYLAYYMRDSFEIWDTDALAGVPMGGVFYAHKVQQILRVSVTDVHAKFHDVRYIQLFKTPDNAMHCHTFMRHGQMIILIEDVLTKGGASAEAIRVLRNANQKPCAVVALFDREEGGKEHIQDTYKIPVYSVVTISDYLADA